MDETENNKAKKKLLKKKLESNFGNKINVTLFCCFKFISTFFGKIKEYNSKISILSQFIISLFPVLIIIAGLLILLHYYLLNKIFKYDFYSIVKGEFVRYFITDLDDINFELSKRKIETLFGDTSNLIFFKIYFQELKEYELFDYNEKIFPDISEQDENIYSLLNNNNSNTIFSIPKNLSKKYIDSRKDCLSEVAKLYYYFYPIIHSEARTLNCFFNQTFLIAYEVNEENNKIKDKKLYFNFPRITDDFIQNNNFFPYNNLISPNINDTLDLSLLTLENDSYIKENWFFELDYNFRVQNNNDFNFNIFHLNENNRGNINKTNAIVMQTFLRNNNNKKYVINIIFFMHQIKFKKGPFEDSVFLISNYSKDFTKYSDAQTYVISNNDIIEVALSSQLDEYFHYGLSSNKDIFFSEGIFYDNIDINELSEPSNNYTTIKGFEFDIRYFSSFYLYAKLFETSKFDSFNKKDDYIYYYKFNDTEQIYNTCKKFNFNLYFDSLNTYEIDCFNEENMLYYSDKNLENYFSEIMTLPHCICLPLYCIKNLNRDIDINNIDFVDKIILPTKCQNDLQFYNNDDEENYSSNDNRFQLTFDEDLKDILENHFIKFERGKFNVNGGLQFVLASLIDNNDMKKIMTNFLLELNETCLKFILIIGIGIGILFILISLVVILYICKISKTITNYKERAFNFLKKLANSKNKNNDINKKSEDVILFGDKSNLETFPLLSKDNDENKNLEENELINDLFKIYCKFNSISENDFFESNEGEEKNKYSMKINKLKNSNELFKLFLKLSLYIPKFRLNISIDYDFYKDSKLIENFKKNYSKKTSSNEDKEQNLYTKSILKEMLSTELIHDYGLITNIYFNYVTNINLDSKKEKKNYIQLGIFKKVEEMMKKNQGRDAYEKNSNDDTNMESIKMVFKNKNIVMKKLEDKFEQDDYLNLSKLKSSFDSTLVNSYYNYIKKIIQEDES